MIYMQSALFDRLGTPDGLRVALQTAIRLEHATIPPYLYTMYSLDPGKNPRVVNLIRGVAMEEMAHFAIACNLLNAIGGDPEIDAPGFVVQYPSSMPGAIHSSLQVNLAAFSKSHLWDVFMEIERPEDPLDFPTARGLQPQQFNTIGDFYRAIRSEIVRLGPPLFSNPRDRQVSSADIGLPNVWAIAEVETAVQAIDHLVEQGEGTTDLPTDERGRLAHYYRFREIYEGRELIKNLSAPPDAPANQKYIYGGARIDVDESGIFPVRTNPRAADFPADVRAKVTEFNAAYTQMLGQLHRGFNGVRAEIGAAIDTMSIELQPRAEELTSIGLPDGTAAAPTFEYQPVP